MILFGFGLSVKASEDASDQRLIVCSGYFQDTTLVLIMEWTCVAFETELAYPSQPVMLWDAMYHTVCRHHT